MQDTYLGTSAVRQETDACDGRINAPQAAQGKVPRPLTSEELHRIEKSALEELYNVTARFTMKPSQDAVSDIYRAMGQFQDAWMAGRRRVMD